MNRDGIGGYVLGDDPRTPTLYTESLSAPLSDLALRDLGVTGRIIRMDETAAKLDVTRELSTEGLTSIQAGMRYSSTLFQRRQGSLSGDTEDGNGNDLTMADGVSPFVVDGTFGHGAGGADFLTTWPSVDPKALYQKFPGTGEIPFDDDNFFDITEDNLAAYIMGNFRHDLGSMGAAGNLGVRFVQTDYAGQGRVSVFDVTGDSYVLDEEPALQNSYEKPLPAFNLTLSPGGGGGTI